MAYTEKDGRLYDQNGSDMGPAKARLDPNGTAIGETRIVQHLPGSNPDLVCQDGRFSLARKPEHEDRRGKRTALQSMWKEGPPTIQERLNAEAKRSEQIRAKIEAEDAQIEQDKIEAPKYVIGLVESVLKTYEAQSKRLTGHDFLRNAVYLHALRKGRDALEKAFVNRAEEHDCARDGCPIGQGCDKDK